MTVKVRIEGQKEVRAALRLVVARSDREAVEMARRRHS